MESGIKKTLIVEDAEFVHQVYRSAFRKLGGYHLIHTHNGQEGLTALEQHGPVELILLDITMPVMTGLEFLAEAGRRKLIRGARVLVLSTEDQDSLIREALSRGAHAFIKKPFTLDELLKLLDRLWKPAARAVGGQPAVSQKE